MSHLIWQLIYGSTTNNARQVIIQNFVQNKQNKKKSTTNFVKQVFNRLLNQKNKHKYKPSILS